VHLGVDFEYPALLVKKEGIMKLAGALAQRSDIDHRIAQLKERVKASARYTEGEEPAENANELLTELIELLARKEHLIARVNHTNSVTVIHLPGNSAVVTITDAIAFRDRLHAQQNLLNEIADAATGSRDSYYGGRRRSELPMKTDLPVKDLRRNADKLAQQYREADQAIQSLNWDTDLI
jgi:hypothetical protein